ncbi:hypothetical protein COCON_G00001280 [Conger conger]|uniref:Mitochondrial transcription rescue factor 1 C-terminal domain-containing protein n=1 Tax=Conger conger TaxID=82655 RepID=A0A9Q1E193_CONCO|nr:hypothetical protein COCON_G00001280 [Conger conger]
MLESAGVNLAASRGIVHFTPGRFCSRVSRFGGVYGDNTRSPGSKKGGKNAKEDEEEEDDPAASDYEDELQDDPGLPKNYKDQERSVQSFRYDLILKAGLDLARNKIDDAFYGNKLRLNGQRLIKKSKTVWSRGMGGQVAAPRLSLRDTLDLVLEDNRDTDVVTLMRVVLKEVVAVTRDEARYRVVLRRWKHLQLPRQEAYRL